MLRLASDADVHGEIIRGLRRRSPEIDLVRVQDALPDRTPDPVVLAWAAMENRVLITNDRNSMVGFAYHRVAAGESVPGLITTTNDQAIGAAIDDILLIAEFMPADEIRDQVVVFLPFRGIVRPPGSGVVRDCRRSTRVTFAAIDSRHRLTQTDRVPSHLPS